MVGVVAISQLFSNFMKKLKIGLLACSSNTGLGYQTRDFYKNIMQSDEGPDYPHKVLIYDISAENGMPTDHSWAYKPRITIGFPSNEDCEWLVDDMDVIFVCETPLNYHLFAYAKAKGIPVVQQYNYEFLDYFRNLNLPRPAVLASPSKWGIDIVKSRNIAPVEYWPVPIDTKKIPFRKMNKVETLVHIIGRPAAYDRNGTIDFCNAAIQLGKKYKYKVYLQPPTDSQSLEHFKKADSYLSRAVEALGDSFEVIENIPNNIDMYSCGEILVLPRRYGGLCLPMWEALSAGMPVIMLDIDPNYTNLPKEWLVKAKLQQTFRAHTEIQVYEVFETKDFLEVIDYVANNIEYYNAVAKLLANRMSWNVQKENYMKKFYELCK